MKNLKKILGVCLVIMLAVVTISTSVNAFSYNDINPDTNNTASVGNVGNQVISIIRILGMIISVGMIMILGIKYMMGSTEQKAEYKKTMIPYLIGAVLIFAATFIVSAIANFATKM